MTYSKAIDNNFIFSICASRVILVINLGHDGMHFITNLFIPPFLPQRWAILSKLREGRYIATQEWPKIISAQCAIPKSNSDKICLIHDASRPANYGLNSLAQPDSFKYQTMDDAVANLAPSYYIAKVDLASAYRCVKIHPDCFDATGLKWKFNGNTMYMYDSRLPFGCSKSLYIFNTLTQSVAWWNARVSWSSDIWMIFWWSGKQWGNVKKEWTAF